MRQLHFILAIAIMAILFACSKELPLDHTDGPGRPDTTGQPGPHQPGPNQPDTTSTDSIIPVRVKAKVMIGQISYDFIPATLQVSSWDSSNQVYEKEITLLAGVNTIPLPKAHLRYRFRLLKWGITDEQMFTNAEVQAGTILELSGSKAPKKLRQEVGYLLIAGAYQVQSKTVYYYRADGYLEHVTYYHKKPQQSDLKLYTTDRFLYEGPLVNQIRRFDENDMQVSTTDFSYNSMGEIINIHQSGYGLETYAAVNYEPSDSIQTLTIDYHYNNGQAMEYKMRFVGGNKVEDIARSSTGGSESGQYGYDQQINPFAHLNIPDIYLSNRSKNNQTSQQKAYAGSVPAGIPYRFEYNYDPEGYPTVLTRHYKSYVTGADLYTIKTVYTY